MIRNKNDLKLISTNYKLEQNKYKASILVCGGAGCVSSGCAEVKAAVIKALEQYELTDIVKVIETGCIGTCSVGPVILIQPEDIFYTSMTPKKVTEIIKANFIENRIIEEYTYFDHTSGRHVPQIENITFFSQQVKIALRNCGLMDYSSIEAYIAREGYFAIARAFKMGREAVIDEVKRSGLRGRGGAGFPTGVKWESGYKQPGDIKYIICNADEGDPGAFMDRSVIE